jgi:hypothetical protein
MSIIISAILLFVPIEPSVLFECWGPGASWMMRVQSVPLHEQLFSYINSLRSGISSHSLTHLPCPRRQPTLTEAPILPRDLPRVSLLVLMLAALL